MEGQPIFTIEAQQQSDAYVMRVGGELDQGACGVLEVALGEAELATPRRIILDTQNPDKPLEARPG